MGIAMKLYKVKINFEAVSVNNLTAEDRRVKSQRTAKY